MHKFYEEDLLRPSSLNVKAWISENVKLAAVSVAEIMREPINQSRI
jgi:hypothetical protein